MDELDNEALPLLLILDDELFPQLLEWSASKGWSDLIIFLLETDYFRFKTNGSFEEAEKVKPGLFESFHLIQKNSGGCFNEFFTAERMKGLKRLVDSGVPLNSIYSQMCNSIWKEMLYRGSQIVDSPFWPTVRRCLIEKHEITIEDMLADPSKRQYFDRYIQGDPADLASLQCLLSVRRILKSLSRFKSDAGTGPIQSSPQTSTGKSAPKTTDYFSFLSGGSSEDGGGSSIMRRWRASKNAVSSASKALQAPFAPSMPSTHSNSSGQLNSHANEYTEPFEAFKIVLEGTRQLQKQFFPSSATVTTGGASAFTTYTTVANTTNGFLYGGHRSHALTSDSTSTASDVGSNPGSPRSNPASPIAGGSGRRGRPGYSSSAIGGVLQHSTSQRNCAGISEALRIEIQSTLTVNASVRAREIETVDRAFAFACAHMLEKLLLALEQEMLTYVTEIFNEFVETTDYAMMVAHARALKCPRIVDYTAKLEFLYDRVRQQRIVSWKDTQTRGKVFLAYEKLNAEGDEISSPLPPDSPVPLQESKGGSTYFAGSTGGNSNKSESCEPSETETPRSNTPYVGEERSVPFKPNVVAISLEIVLPHTTLLSPATVGTCPHRVALYAGGRRRAARLRRKTPGLTPAASARTLTLMGTSGKHTPTSGGSGTAGGSMKLKAAPGELPPIPPVPSIVLSPSQNQNSKSPMRRTSSVKFHLGDVTPSSVPFSTSTAGTTSAEPLVVNSHAVDEATAAASAEVKTDEALSPPLARARSISDSEHDPDTLSELPSLGIAGSIKSRNIAGVHSIGAAGADCFNDIVDSNDSFGAADEEVLGEEVESSGSTSANSDSSSDYDGELRQVYSSTDLDQLIRMGSSPIGEDGTSSADNADSPQITPRAAGGSGMGARSRRGSSARLRSRAGSYMSVNSTATGATGVPRDATLEGMSYDDGVRRLAAIDFTKLDRTLHREVLGAAQITANMTAPPAGPSSTSSGGAGTASASTVASRASAGSNKKITTKGLVAALAVALAGVKDDDDHFARKFATEVEESFTFTTDTKGLGLLTDLLFTKHPSWHGAEHMVAYMKAFETATSVFRQNSMLDTSRPVYRVCVQVQSSVISSVEASRLKAQFATLEAESRSATPPTSTGTAGVGGSGGGRGVPKAPLHPSRPHHPTSPKIAHSHVRIAVSYSLLTPGHTMLTALRSLAFAAWNTMQPATGSLCSDLSEDQNEQKQATAAPEPGALMPFPLKLRYADHFAEYARCPPPPPSPPTTDRKEAADQVAKVETLYDLYLGSHPGYKGLKGAAPESPQSRATAAQPQFLCEPITRHIGACDFSLSELLVAISPRLMLQTLMLVLVDRPIMLISTSSTLLSQVQAAIPRLIWPFRIDTTHVVRQILSGAELHHFVYRHDVPFVTETQQPVIREKKLNRKTSSWREMITRFAANVGSTLKSAAAGVITSHEPGSPGSTQSGLRSPRGSFTRQRKSGSTNDLLSGVLRRTASGTAMQTGSTAGSDDGDRKSESNSPITLSVDTSAPGSRNSPQPEGARSPYTRIVTPPSLQLPTPTAHLGDGDGEDGMVDVLVDQFSCILGVDATAFYNSAPELKEELECMRIRGSGFTFIDLDTGYILNRRPDDFSEDDGESPPKPLPSRLSDAEIFRISDFGILRSLIKTLGRVNEDMCAFLRQDEEEHAYCGYGSISREGGGPNVQDSVGRAAILAQKIAACNREVEQAFYAFWSEFVLRAIPKCIQHFPGPRVISCDIRAVLTELLHTVVATSASYDMGDDFEDLLPTPGQPGATPSTNPTTAAYYGKGAASLLGDLNLRQLPPTAVPQTPMATHMQNMPFEEFLAMFIEQVANHGESNMCYAFYKEFIADGSVVFKNLLLRHSAVLEKWAI